MFTAYTFVDKSSITGHKEKRFLVIGLWNKNTSRLRILTFGKPFPEGGTPKKKKSTLSLITSSVFDDRQMKMNGEVQ